MARLKELGEELSCTWNPITERWYLWSKANINHKLCQGWRLLFVNQEPDGSYLPLDERVFARLVAASVLTHGSAKAYFERIKSEMERDKAKREAQARQDQIDIAMPFWEHSQIKNIGKGSKFSTYHS